MEDKVAKAVTEFKRAKRKSITVYERTYREALEQGNRGKAQAYLEAIGALKSAKNFEELIAASRSIRGKF